MPWGAAIAGAAALGSAAISSSAAGGAASAQAGSEQQARDFAQSQLDRQIGNTVSYVSGGYQANNALLQLLGLSSGTDGNGNPISTSAVQNGTYNPNSSTLLAPFTAAQFQQSPGYQYQLNQSNGAILNNATATGGVGGNALKALQTNANGLANQDWYNAMNAYYNQQNSVYNKLSGTAATGLNATNAIAGVGTNISGQVGNALTGAGNANAAGIVGQANAGTGALGSLGQLAYLYGGGSGGGGNSFLLGNASSGGLLTGGGGLSPSFLGSDPYAGMTGIY